MLKPERKKVLLADAKTFSATLAGSEVTRSEWSHVPNALYLGADPSKRDLATAQELIAALPGSWVGRRSGKTRKQLNQVRLTLQEIARKNLDDEELRYLLGWISRMLIIRKKAARR